MRLRSCPLVTAGSVVIIAAGAVGALPALGSAQAAGRDTARSVGTVNVTGHRAPTVSGGAGTLGARVDSLPTTPVPTLETALRRLPFVSVRTNSRGEAELSIRGSESRTPTVLLDGLPLTLGWDSRTDPSLIPLSGVTTIRLSRSMGSILAGPNAVGGVIELDFARAPLAVNSARVATGLDQLGAHVVAGSFASAIQTGAGTLAIRAGASLRDRPALARAGDVLDPDAADGERINSDSRLTDLFASARFGRVSGAYVSTGVSVYDAERGVQPELHIVEPRLWRYPSQSRMFASLGAGTGVRSSPFGHMSVDASVGLNAGENEINVFTDRTYSAIDSREFGDERTIVSRGVLTHSLPRNATLRLGGTMSNVRYLETFDDNPSTEYRQRLWSLGAEATIPLSGRLSAAVGFALDGAANPESGGRTEGDDARDDWAGRLGLTADVGRTRFHAAASQRSRFPALRELYSGSLGRFEPSPRLRPERLTIIEGGATANVGALELQGVVFRQVNEDGVIRVTLPNNQFQRQNKDEIRSTGLEMVGTWSRGRATVVGDALVQKVRVHDITNNGSKRRPENVPESRFTLGAIVPTVAAIDANAWITRTGNQYCEAGQTEVDGGVRLDAGVERAFAMARGWFRGLRISVGVDNITDSAIYDQCGLPQPGRTIRAGIVLAR